jgi:general secretion pathway protein F
MPLYRWRALDRAGHIAEGEMDASSQSQVAERLRRAGCLILAAEAVGPHLLPPGVMGLLKRRAVLPPRVLAPLFRQMSLLLAAGLPLDRTLEALAALGAGTSPGAVAAALATRVAAGASLADSMEAEAGLFPRLAIGMIRSGEAMGALPILVNRVAESNRRAVTLRDPVVGGTLRALAVLLAVLGAVSLAGGDGPAAWLPAAGSVVALVLLYGFDSAARHRVNAMALALPGLGPLLAAIEMARLLRGASILLACGAPLPVALAVLRLRAGDGVVASHLAAAGKVFPLSQAITAVPNFSCRAVRLMAAGEYSGRRAEAAARAALLIEARTRRTLHRLIVSTAAGLCLVVVVFLAIKGLT